MKAKTLPAPPAPARCGYCNAGLLHEVVRFTVQVDEIFAPACSSCVRDVLDRLDGVRREVAEELEEWWAGGSDGPHVGDRQ